MFIFKHTDQGKTLNRRLKVKDKYAVKDKLAKMSLEYKKNSQRKLNHVKIKKNKIQL